MVGLLGYKRGFACLFFAEGLEHQLGISGRGEGHHGSSFPLSVYKSPHVRRVLPSQMVSYKNPQACVL